jgi:hypothetical protein
MSKNISIFVRKPKKVTPSNENGDHPTVDSAQAVITPATSTPDTTTQATSTPDTSTQATSTPATSTPSVEVRGKTKIRRIGAKTSEEPVIESEKKSEKMSDSECITILDQINGEKSDSLKTREDIIYELEIKKKKLNEQLKTGKNPTGVARELEGLKRLLKDVRSAELDDKYRNADNDLKCKIVEWFIKNKKKLDPEVFSRSIDLTAPKSDRTADPNDQIFTTSKSYFKAHKNYEECDPSVSSKTMKKIKKKKPIPSELLEQINTSATRNLIKLDAITRKDQDVVGYRQYDPFSHRGISY